MASGAIVVDIIRVMPPATTYARVDTRPGGSTPVESVTVYKFAAGSTEILDYLCRLQGYGGGGLTFETPYSMASATTGGVRIEIAIRRLQASTEDIDTSQTYDFNGVTDTVPGTNGTLKQPTITFTNGADMDSWANGELAIVRVRRKHDDAGDDAAGDWELWDLVGKET